MWKVETNINQSTDTCHTCDDMKNISLHDELSGILIARWIL